MAQPTPLKRAIFDSGRTQRSVAEASGLREDVLSRIVSGRVNSTDDERIAIAAALDRPVDDVFGDGHATDSAPVQGSAQTGRNADEDNQKEAA